MREFARTIEIEPQKYAYYEDAARFKKQFLPVSLTRQWGGYLLGRGEPPITSRDLAALAGVTSISGLERIPDESEQGTLGFERGKTSLRMTETPGAGGQAGGINQPAPPLDVYASAQGGPEGAWILSSDPVAQIQRDERLIGVREAFACYVEGESMLRAYEPRNLVLVNPSVPPGPGDDVLLVRETIDGERYALIKRLTKFTDAEWIVTQWNPERTYSLAKREWQRAMLVIGKYNRG